MRVCGVEGWKERRGKMWSKGVWSRGVLVKMQTGRCYEGSHS